MQKTFNFIGILTLLLILSGQTFAQNDNKDSKYKYTVQPYFMFPNLNGKMGLADLPDANVDANPGDVFSHLQFGAMLNFEVHNNKWAFGSDMLYMSLSQDLKSGPIIQSGVATSKQFGWELSALRKIMPWFEAGAGLRLNNLKAGLNMNVVSGIGQTTNKNLSSTNTWVDPIIVARVKTPSKGKFGAQLRTDIGGFGIGSKFCWQLQADAVYHVSKLLDLDLGYRYLGVNYEKGSGQDRFLYNVDTFGPVIRFGLNL